MATCTHRIGTADSGNSPNTTGLFIPALNDLLIGFVVASDTTDAAGTFSNSTGTTFTLVLKATFASSAHAIYAFVANSLVTSIASQTCTWTQSSDTASGTVIFVCSVSGMQRSGTSAIRQSAKQDNQAASGTPAPAFSSSVLTGNPTLGVIGNSSNPAGLTPPTSWTEPANGDLGYNSPSTGGEYVFRDSGFTGTTVTWGGTSASAFGSLIIELDTTGPLALKDVIMSRMVPVKRN